MNKLATRYYERIVRKPAYFIYARRKRIAREIVEGNPTVRVFVFHKGNYSLLALKRRKKAPRISGALKVFHPTVFARP